MLYNVPNNKLSEMADVSADAFISQNDPIGNYMFEMEDDREELKRKFFRSLVTASPKNAIYQATSPKLEAVSIWFPPNVSHLEDVDCGDDKLLPESFKHSNTIKRLQIIDNIIAELTTDIGDEPQWYLHLVAVSPRFIKQGLSSLLIKPILERAKKEKLPCSLITQHFGNAKIYMHLGFEIVKEKQVPNSQAKFYSMKTKV